MQTALVNRGAVVPRNLFGDVPDGFVADLGRVAMLAAMLDQRIHDLYVQIYATVQSAEAGAPSSHLINLCRKKLHLFRQDDQQRVAEFMEAAIACIKWRNAALHSLWVFDGASSYGWRYPRGALGASGEVVTQCPGRLASLVVDLVNLNTECQNIALLVPVRGQI